MASYKIILIYHQESMSRVSNRDLYVIPFIELNIYNFLLRLEGKVSTEHLQSKMGYIENVSCWAQLSNSSANSKHGPCENHKKRS